MITFKVYRIIHELGWVEFKIENEAIEYRDINHPGCDIVVLDREINEEDLYN